MCVGNASARIVRRQHRFRSFLLSYTFNSSHCSLLSKALRFVSDIFAETIVNFAQSITQLIHGQECIPHVVEAEVKRAASLKDKNGELLLDTFPKKCVFELPSSVLEKIYFAETALGDQIVATDTVVLEFKGYGKKLIVANRLR